MLVLAVAAWPSRLAQAVVIGFGLLAGAALLRLMSRRAAFLPDAPLYFLLGQFAMGVGLLKGLVGRQSVLWAKADR
jgi:hypothetical protein